MPAQDFATKGYDYAGLTNQYEDLARTTRDTTKAIVDSSAGVIQPGVTVSGSTPQSFQSGMSTWAGGSPGTANRSASGGRSGGGAIAAGTNTPAIPEPKYNAPKAPTMPEYTAREYSPPGEDKSYESAKRRELMGAGVRALRQGTQEAIVGARSLDNPAARKSFVRDTLEGYGRGLESVSAGATKGAMAAAGQKRAEQLKIYDTQYSNKSSADKVNYENEVNRLGADFASAQWGAQSDYSTQRSAYLSQPQANIASGGAIPAASTSKNPEMSAWYKQQLNAPNMGYFHG